MRAGVPYGCHDQEGGLDGAYEDRGGRRRRPGDPHGLEAPGGVGDQGGPPREDWGDLRDGPEGGPCDGEHPGRRRAAQPPDKGGRCGCPPRLRARRGRQEGGRLPQEGRFGFGEYPCDGSRRGHLWHDGVPQDGGSDGPPQGGDPQDRLLRRHRTGRGGRGPHSHERGHDRSPRRQRSAPLRGGDRAPGDEGEPEAQVLRSQLEGIPAG